MKTFSDLQSRGLVKQSSDPSLEKLLNEGSITFYCGFDPTADSLHVGSLLPLITMRRLQMAGHKPLALVGGFTGMIGDPSFKKDERKLLNEETLNKNVLGIKKSIGQILSDFTIVNNFDWLGKMSALSFLRDLGKLFSVNSMMQKESVSSRLNDPDKGISFTEFSYMMLQAEDFRHLFETHKCVLQVGGSDQWGNIVSGIDLVRRRHNGQAFGLTLPLLTKSDGTKFGKSEKGNVWLDKEKTSVFDFFQFFINTEDKDVIELLKKLTFLSLEEIEAVEKNMHTSPRFAQKVLATEVTRLVHGEEELQKALVETDKRFEAPNWSEASVDLTIAKSELLEMSLVDLLVRVNLSPSKSMARKDVEGNGISVNQVKASNALMKMDESLIQGNRLVLSKGKKNHKVIEVI